MIVDKLASFGQLTTLLLLISPFPSFVFCHKKSLEKNAQMSQVSYKYLLANFVCSAVWLAYSLKVDNTDLIVINFLATVLTCLFLGLYVYVKVKVGHHQKSFMFLILSTPIIFAAYSESLSTSSTGLMATSLSVITYGMSLDNISVTLKTRDSAQVNMGITIACVLNGVIWMCYAILVQDIYVLIPNLMALASASIQLNLYKWSTGKLENTHWLIKLLQKYFNPKGNKAIKAKKEVVYFKANTIEPNSTNCGSDDEESIM